MNFLGGVIGGAMAAGGAELVQMGREQGADERIRARELERMKLEEERTLRLDEIRSKRAETQRLKLKDEAIADLTPGSPVSNVTAAAADEAAIREALRKNDPDVIALERAGGAARAKGLPQKLGAGEGIYAIDPATGKQTTILKSEFAPRNSAKGTDKLPPAYVAAAKRFDKEEDEIRKEQGELRKEQRGAGTLDPKAVAAWEAELSQRSKGLNTQRRSLDYRHDMVDPVDDAAKIAPGLKDVPDLEKQLSAMRAAGARPAHIEAVRSTILKSMDLPAQAQPAAGPAGPAAPGIPMNTGSETRASAAAGIPPQPREPNEMERMQAEQKRAGATMSYGSPGMSTLPKSRPVGVLEAVAPPATPQPMAATEPQVTGDPSTGLMPPTQPPVIASAQGVDLFSSSGGAGLFTPGMPVPPKVARNQAVYSALLAAGGLDQNASPDDIVGSSGTPALADNRSVRGRPAIAAKTAPVAEIAGAGIVSAGQVSAPDLNSLSSARAALTTRLKNTVTNTGRQELATKKTEASNLTAAAIAVMTPQEAGALIERLAPVLTPQQYAALKERKRG